MVDRSSIHRPGNRVNVDWSGLVFLVGVAAFTLLSILNQFYWCALTLAAPFVSQYLAAGRRELNPAVARVSLVLRVLAALAAAAYLALNARYYSAAFVALWFLPLTRSGLKSDGKMQLFRGAKAGDVDLVESALHAGTPVDVRIGGLTPLLRAVTSARTIPPSGSGRVDRTNEHLARYAETIATLVAAGADINAKTDSGQSAILLATGNNWLTGLLLEHGADPSARGNHEYNALHQAALKRDIHSLRRLLDSGADPLVKTEFGDTAVHLALRSTDSGGGVMGYEAPRWQIVELLLSHGANLNEPGGNGRTPLMLAAAIEDGESFGATKFLIRNGAEVSSVDSAGDSALLIAVRGKSDKSNVCRELLAGGAAVRVQHLNATKSALYEAAKAGNQRCVADLLELGTDLDIRTWGALAIEVARNRVIVDMLRTHMAKSA